MHRAKTAPQTQGGGLAVPDEAAFLTASAKGRYGKEAFYPGLSDDYVFFTGSVHYHRYKNRDEDPGNKIRIGKK